jgi:folate-binding protein YgfZ
VLADVDRGALPELLFHLRKYRLRANVDVADVSDEHRVWAHFGPSAVPAIIASEDLSTDHSTAAADLGRWSVDPRLPVLGSRGVFPADVVPTAPASTGTLVDDSSSSVAGTASPAGSSEVEQLAGEAEYAHFLWRVAHGVGEGPVEIPHAEALPLEYNLAGLNAISFKKGCYLGQASVLPHSRPLQRRFVEVARNARRTWMRRCAELIESAGATV